jgi:carboxyl-terminal processing protease
MVSRWVNGWTFGIVLEKWRAGSFANEQDRQVKVEPVARLLSTAPGQEVRVLAGGVIYLRFDGFDAVDRRWLSQQLKDHAAAPAVMVDLRHNSGGDTFSLGTVIGEFFDRRVDWRDFHHARRKLRREALVAVGISGLSGAVALLIDAETASAAEIFAAVMREQGRAVLVGRKTAGAVLASTFMLCRMEGNCSSVVKTTALRAESASRGRAWSRTCP